MTTKRKQPIEVRPAGPGSGWVLARLGDPNVISRHDTQLAAIKVGKPLARRDETEFVLRGRDGRVRSRSSYRDAGAPRRRPNPARTRAAATSPERHLVPEVDRTEFESLFYPGTRMPLPALLLDRIDGALLRARRANCSIALLVVGEIESENTETAVDYMAVAPVLESVMRPGDTIALGPDGSTLVVVCNTISCAADAEMIAARLVDKAGVRCQIQSTFSGDDRDAAVLLRRAFKRWATGQERRRAEVQRASAADN
jgi:Uncharacterized protein conserved in bacteria (DUF2188)